MLVILIISIFKIASCAQYLNDANNLHGPITSYDRQAKTVKYCIYMNNQTLDVNYLLGTWYKVYQFAVGVSPIGTEYCPVNIFTRPTTAELDAYKAKYNLQNETFSFDDGAMLLSQLNGKLRGIVVGNKTAKYYFLDTKSGQRLSGMYQVQTYKRVNNDYLIYYRCEMRGHVKYLWSRKNNQTDAELSKILEPLYELPGGKQRFCAKKKVVSTTPYF